ncbi:FAD-binding protein [Herbiconiux sp. CPCC 205763]|uniref:FAD-binding protein n=1 Tax=Herbiconiux aconitum TaxID=2970913 RepID=A0ABT2GKV7_9MICO|nr:D-arabinono-1,4-lactone oxidase [Herbiconiux aconitum]MCS5716857.1 FAD-binding protein [Herbiconiux aconitum]
MTTIGANWAGTYEYGAERLLRPRSTEEVAAIVAGASRVRALGTRHSFNDLADSTGDLLSLVDLEAHPVIDAAASTVTVASGTRFAVLAAHLEAHGYALHNLGSLPHISIAGAVATGTHGSGVGNGNLSTAVAGLELVTGRGDVVHVSRADPRFDGMVVALGALGVVTRITLDIQPTFRMRQDIYLDLPWDAVLSTFDEIVSAAYSVSLFTDWTGDALKQVWLKSRLPDASSGVAALLLPDDFFGAHPAGDKVMSPAGDDIDNTTVQGGVPGPWSERLPHFRADVTPSNGDEIQTEYFVDRKDAVAAITAVRALADRIAPHLLVTELRTVAADTLWLSPAYQRESLAIHFTWRNEPAEVHALLPEIEAVLAPFDARPHWGKWFAMGADEIVPKYERAADFRALAEAFDPQGRFRNDYLERVLALPLR